MVNTPWKRTSKGFGDQKEKHFHKVVPLAENPCKGADYAEAVFSQRHEADPEELCFDLFFVANLATFTAYHTIDDYTSLGAYVGFFAILWATWFQITLHDVRFARDSVYERLCKMVQFIVFVGLALAGSKFDPSGSAKANMNFRTMCYMLVLSRTLLALQYLFVLVAVARRGFSRLYLPIGLNMAIYIMVATAFGAMSPAFANDAGPRTQIYWLWWIIIALEGVGTIVISSCWRMLSFKKTHLVERMGLLTLIVIGEGAIGVTKTVSLLVGQHGRNVEGMLPVFTIVLILVMLFLLYFDNAPHGHFGTIRQQVWALLHFPFQLSVVGVVEGSQRVALSRYVMNGVEKFQENVVEYCVKDGLEGDKLVEKLSSAIKYYKLDYKPETYRELQQIKEALKTIGTLKGICNAAHTDAFPAPGWTYKFPQEFDMLVREVGSGMSMSMGMKIPIEDEPWKVMMNSWRIVYLYYWVSFAVLFACTIAFLLLIHSRLHKADLFDLVSLGNRTALFAASLLLASLTARDKAYAAFLQSGFVNPAGALMLALTLVGDHAARFICNYRLRRAGFEPPIELVLLSHGSHDGGGGGVHGGVHQHPGHKRVDSHQQDDPERKLTRRLSNPLRYGAKYVDVDEDYDADTVPLRPQRPAHVRGKSSGSGKSFGQPESPPLGASAAVCLMGDLAASSMVGRTVQEGAVGGNGGGGGVRTSPVQREEGRLRVVGGGRGGGKYERVSGGEEEEDEDEDEEEVGERRRRSDGDWDEGW